MTDEAKLNRLKILLEETGSDEGELLEEYLAIAKDEILNWLYIRLGAVPPEVDEVPAAYEQVQIMAVVAAYNIRGAEGQTLHIENGMHRDFVYDDLVKYVRTHVFPYVRLS
jgi:hypothetical protein